jgi:hypothetical protein
MKDLYHAIDALNNIVNEEPPRGRQDGPGTRQGTPQTPKPAAPKPAAATPRPAAVSPAPGVGRQDGPGLPKPAAPKINPAVPAAGPVRANPINPQAMAATKAAASVVNAPKMAMPTPKPAAPAPRAKVKATAANTKDYDKTVALQKKLGVTADGIMGPQTRAAMAAAAAKKPATPASQVTPTAGDPGSQQSASPAPTGTARKVSTVVPGAAASAQDAYAARVAKSNAALAGDVKKAARGAGEIASGGRAGGILDKIGAGISSLFKPSERSVIGRKQAAPAAGSNAAGSNFATAADGSISRTDNPRQPGDAAPTTRTAAATDAAPTRRNNTSFKASDGTNKIVKGDDGRLYVDQKVTDPKAKQALIDKVKRAREMQQLAFSAGSRDPKVIRAYQNTMKNTKGMGAAGGTDPNTF